MKSPVRMSLLITYYTRIVVLYLFRPSRWLHAHSSSYLLRPVRRCLSSSTIWLVRAMSQHHRAPFFFRPHGFSSSIARPAFRKAQPIIKRRRLHRSSVPLRAKAWLCRSRPPTATTFPSPRRHRHLHRLSRSRSRRRHARRAAPRTPSR